MRSALLAAYLAPSAPAQYGATATAAAAASPAAAATSPTAAAASLAAGGERFGVQVDEMADAVVIGTGVAGMTAALRLLDRGAAVVILDKERQVRSPPDLRLISAGSPLELPSSSRHPGQGAISA